MPAPRKIPPPHVPRGAGAFVTTHWSVIAAAGASNERSHHALDILCRQYWPPVYAFIRRRGHGPEEAQDLTQGFFSRLLERNCVESADPVKGRFRTFLLTAVTRFLVNEYERARAQKRGGGRVHFSIDEPGLEAGSARVPSDPLTPETIFERSWAETLLTGVLARLRQEYENTGELQRFECLQPFLSGEKPPSSGAELASQLGIAESSAYSAISRIRKRYGELLREEIAHTVARPEEVEEELRHLARVLSGS